MGSWHDGVWSWELNWRRDLREWERVWVAELLSIIRQVQLKENTVDKWLWKDNICEGFSVKSAYSLLRGDSNQQQLNEFMNIWVAYVPSNVKTFIWKLHWGRVQTKQNLSRRGIQLNTPDSLCPFCSDYEESVEHLFFSCRKTSSVWYSCLKWLGYCTALPNDSKAHFLQFIHGNWIRKQQRVWWAIWGAIVWTIWCSRNRLVFSHEAPDWDNLLDVIQWKAWIWISSEVKEFQCAMVEWVMNPYSCISQV